MKNCIICNKKKPLTDYYKHSQMSDGYLNKCKDCCKIQAKEREELLRKNPKWAEKERTRHRDKYHRLEYREIHKPTYEQKKVQMKRYIDKYPEKLQAKLNSQNLKVNIKGNNLHHWSYNEEHYKDVIELSVKDHATIHRFTTYDQERMMYRISSNGILLDTREKSIEFYNALEIETINQ